jgi:REP element-mobilizing transposase RayT
MVLGYHVIFSASGFWLPNDPRGSWSDFVGSWELFRFGPATKTTERRSLAREPHNGTRRLAAKSSLKYPAVHFTGIQAREIGRGFERRVTNSGMTVWACSILPEHVHMVIGRHSYDVERMVILLKSEATEHLIGAQLHPLAEFQDAKGKYPSVWSRGEWKVFLDSPEDINRSIRYVEENPLKEGKPRQNWKFVVPYNRETDDENTTETV